MAGSTVLANSTFQITVHIQANFVMAKPKDKGGSAIRTGIFMSGNGEMIKLMDMENILELMEQCLRGNGRRIRGLDEEQNFGMTGLGLKASMLTTKKMGRENSNGLMAVSL